MSTNRIRGVPRPNKLVQYDNEYGFQFRIQCEVPISNGDLAMELLWHLKSNTKEGFTSAKNIVDDVIEEYNKASKGGKISELSKRIIGMAMNDSIKNANSSNSASRLAKRPR